MSDIGVVAALRRMRLPLENEKVLQALIAERLGEMFVLFEREKKVSSGVIDFFLPVEGIGIEVKIAGTRASIERQIAGYAKDGRLREMVLVTSKAVGLPASIEGKPVSVINIAIGWL